MSEHVIPNTGEYADLCLGPSHEIYVAAETADRTAVQVFAGTSGHSILAHLDGAVVGGQVMALYPRIAINPFGELAVGYQRGAHLCISFLGVTEDLRPRSEEPFGTEMVCVAWLPQAGAWRAAYVARIEGTIYLVTLDYRRSGEPLGSSWVPTDTTQGISRLLDDGTVVTIDQDNRWPQYPNLSRPVRAGVLVVGQGNDAPARALGYLDGDTTTAYRIFDGIAFRPRTVEVAADSWTVICTGHRVGVRVTEVPPAALDVPETEPPPIIIEPPELIEPPIEPPIDPEEPMAKPYNEDYYMSSEAGKGAAPMFEGDKTGVMNQLYADYRVMGREPDHEYGIHGVRTEHDYQAGMTLAASWKKHRNEARALLNPEGDKLPQFPPDPS